MAINAGDILRLDTQFVADGSELLINAFHCQVQTQPTGTDQEFIDDLGTYFVASYDLAASRVNDGIVGSQLRVSKRIGSNSFTEVGTTSLSAFQGGVGTPSLPYTTAPTVKFGVIGQGRQGRKSFLPVVNNVVNENILSIAAITDLLLWANRFNSIAIEGSANVFFGIYKRATDLFVGFSGTIVVNTVLGTMVTRKPGRGA